MSTAAQVRCIQTLRRRAGLEEADYRGFLVHHGGEASSKDLSDRAADRVIAALRKLPGAGARSPATTASGRFAPKLQSLWISGWNLGVIRDKSDRAMLAWLKARFGVDHPRFLVDAADAWPAIEGLKAWLAREGRVKWVSDAAPRDQARAVCEAIAARLLALDDKVAGMRPCLFGAQHGLPERAADYSVRDFHALANLLGERLRARLAPRPFDPARPADGAEVYVTLQPGGGAGEPA